MSREVLMWAVMAAMAVPAYGQSRLTEGNPDSAVRVLIFEDLQCPDCAAFRVMLDEKLLPKYGKTVAFEHRDFPLPKHKWAKQASIASRYWETVDREIALAWRRETMAKLREIPADGLPAHLRAFAARHKQDPEKAIAALSDEDLRKAVEEDYEDGVARGIAKTPTALVNGRPFIETFTFEEIAAGIEEALKEAGAK
jgi:protein-disulfide isomerase